ncbi:TlpA family protein disulfide reductase [bacterium]|nr:TlpA family protein disulfide reductase [bacterium]
MRIFLLTLILVSAVFAAPTESANIFGEKEPVAKAFLEISKRLASLESLDIVYTSMVHSLQGDVIQSGTILQEPPYRFRSEVWTHAMEGITRSHELTVSNGTNGWEVSIAPNGKTVAVSFWTLASMGDIFFSFLERATPYLITPAKTNSYDGLRYNYIFTDVSKNADGWDFKGNIRHDSELLKGIAKQASAMGAAGFSNFVPDHVSMKVSKDGIITEFKRFNLKGELLSYVNLKRALVNTYVDNAQFYYTPPQGVFLSNLDILQELPSMYVKHALLYKKAPDIKVNYLSGKDKIIKPGSKGVIVLTFFASWSQLCREYMVVIDKLHSKYAGTGVQFVNVSDQQDMKTLLAFQRGFDTIIYADPERSLVKTYDIDNIPKTFLIDKQGIVRYVMEGFNTASEVELGKRIDELKDEKLPEEEKKDK